MSHDEQPLLEAIERLLDKRLPQEWLKGYEPSPVVMSDESNAPRRNSRSSEKRKMKAKLKIHANRGKKQ
jgi:ATP-dependent RNA helicase RhlE